MNDKGTGLPRVLLVCAGLTMALSSVMKEWRISILAIVLLAGALVTLFLNATRDTSEARIDQAINAGNTLSGKNKTPKVL